MCESIHPATLQIILELLYDTMLYKNIRRLRACTLHWPHCTSSASVITCSMVENACPHIYMLGQSRVQGTVPALSLDLPARRSYIPSTHSIADHAILVTATFLRKQQSFRTSRYYLVACTMRDVWRMPRPTKIVQSLGSVVTWSRCNRSL